jgi:predicted Zn-dependent protease
MLRKTRSRKRRISSVTPFIFFSLFGMAAVASFFLFWTGVNPQEANGTLPPLQVHPLPDQLAQWQDHQQQGDYFAEIQDTPVGYLIWSEFPIKVYLDRPVEPEDGTASYLRFQQWVELVLEGIKEWQDYLPLQVVEKAELADICIYRQYPPLGTKIEPETGKLEIPRSRTAQTRYEFYLDQRTPPVLRHRMIVQISPNLSHTAILSATRHEFGHALGIWGHSTVETDVLYFSQVQNPPSISVRDINTLKKIYQQPTRLGWEVITKVESSDIGQGKK